MRRLPPQALAAIRPVLAMTALASACAAPRASRGPAPVTENPAATAALAKLPACRELPRPSRTSGHLRLATTLCTARACPAAQRCCNACRWSATLVASWGKRTLDAAWVSRTLGGPPEQALDCEVADWDRAVREAEIAVVGLPPEGGGEAAVAQPAGMCLEAADR